MTNRCNNLGRAFEYACILELQERISKHRPVEINQNSTGASYRAWELQETTIKEKFMISAAAFIDSLFEAEPLILECTMPLLM